MEGSRFPAKPPLAQVDVAAPEVSIPPDSELASGRGAQLSGATVAVAGQLFSLQLTEEQRSHLAFAVLCQVDGLYESDEADEPEVLAAIRHLEAVQRLLKGQL